MKPTESEAPEGIFQRQRLVFKILLRFALHFICVGLAILWLLWLIGQFTRDRNAGLGLLFDIPSPAVALLIVCSAIVCAISKKRIYALVLFLLAAPPSVMTAHGENIFWRHAIAPNAMPSSQPHLRVVHWNVAWGIYGWDAVVNQLRGEQANLYVLTEIPRRRSLDALAKSFGSDWHALRLNGMAAIGKGELSNVKWLENANGLRVCSFNWEYASGSHFKIIAADLLSNPLVAHRVLLEKLRGHIVSEQPDLIVGDFNTPRRSLGLTPAPQGYVHAYNKIGCGWGYTWPMPIPCIAIDQCLVRKNLRLIDYELKSSAYSDHRRQVIDFELK